MKFKKHIIIAGAIVFLVALWLCMNPIGRFGICTFGITTWNAIPIPLSDIQVRSDGKSRTVNKTHDLKMEDVAWLLASQPDILIVGIGWDGAVKPRNSIEDYENCDVIVLKTDDAVQLYNRLKREGKKVSIHVHSTC